VGIDEYYKHYLSLHQNINCRRLHFIGQLVTILYVMYALHSGYVILLLAAPFIIYPFAWSGHYFFENNTPAAYKDPIKAKISDWIMFKDIILGKIKIW